MIRYNQRLATLEDKTAIAPLWRSFAEERAQSDPSITLNPNFNFERYVGYQLAKPLSFCFVLEFDVQKPGNLLTLESPAFMAGESQKQIVGFISVYVYDEAPPLPLSTDIEILENPFKPRRVGAVLGLYVEEQHRKPETIKLLIDTALAKANELKLSDIDLLISIEQTGVQALLTRAGFTKSAIQYTKHFEISGIELPSLYPNHLKIEEIEFPVEAIPLRDPKTNRVVKNPQGELVFLYPVKDEIGRVYKNSRKLPIYPTPIREPQTQEWVFDYQDKLVVSPVIIDADGEIIEYQEIPQFCPPDYEQVEGKLQLKCDENGNYVFLEVERNESGKVVRSPEGKPIFKRR